MKRLRTSLLVTVVALILAACGGSGAGDDATTTTEAAGEEVAITIANFAFSGPETVSVNDTITITNEDSVGHTWTDVDGDFDSGTLAEGESFEFSFDEPGEYEFFCSIHPQMEGSITVEG